MSQGQEIRLERNAEGFLIGRIFVNGRRSSAFVLYAEETSYLFSPEQVDELTNEIF